MTSLLDSSLCVRLALVLLHFLWQGVAIAAVAGVVVLFLRRGPAAARYTIWLGALLAMAACPVGTFLWLEPQSPASQAIAAVHSPLSQPPSLVRRVTGPVAPTRLPLASASPRSAPSPQPSSDRAEHAAPAAPPMPRLQPQPVLPPAPAAAAQPAPVRYLLQFCREYAPLIVIGYFAGVGLILARLLLGLYGGGRLRRRSEPLTDADLLAALSRQAHRLGLRVVPTIAWCRRVFMPTVIGVIRPTILLPFSIASGMSPQQVEALLAHELAHIGRYDPIANILQRLIEAFLFFHPAMWFVSGRIRTERELCCDDWVVRSGSTALDYAACLVRAAELCSMDRRSPIASAALAAADRTSHLRHRVLRLLGVASEEPVRLAHAWPTVVVVAALTVLLAGHHLYGLVVTPKLFDGDPALFKQVAEAHKANRQAIRTWKGQATIENMTYAKVPAAGDQPTRQDAGRVEFVLDVVGNRLRSNKQGQMGSTTNLILDGPDGYQVCGGAGSMSQLVVFSRSHVESNPEPFDPMKLLTQAHYQDIEEDLLRQYRQATEAPPQKDKIPSNWSNTLRREGDLVVLTRSGGNHSLKVVYDLAKGGNLISYEQDALTGSESVRYTYGQHEGVWVPVTVETANVQRTEGVGVNTRIQRIIFADQKVNGPIPDSEFEVAKLGIRKGDVVTDWRADPNVVTFEFAKPFTASTEGSALPAWVARKAGTTSDASASAAWRASVAAGQDIELLGLGRQHRQDRSTWCEWWLPDGRPVRTMFSIAKTGDADGAAVFRITAPAEVLRGWAIVGSTRSAYQLAHHLPAGDIWATTFAMPADAQQVSFELQLGTVAKELFRVPLVFQKTPEIALNQNGIEKVVAAWPRGRQSMTLDVFHRADLPGDRFLLLGDNDLQFTPASQVTEKIDDQHQVTHLAVPGRGVTGLVRQQLQWQTIPIPAAAAKANAAPAQNGEAGRCLAALSATSRPADAAATAPSAPATAPASEQAGPPNLHFEPFPAEQASFYSMQGSPALTLPDPRPNFCRSERPLLHYTPSGILPIRMLFDESAGTGKGYDTLYVDFNNNGDYLDDPVYKAAALDTTKGPDGQSLLAYFPSVRIWRSGRQGLSVSVQIFLEKEERYGRDAGSVPIKCCFIPQTWAVGTVQVGDHASRAALVDSNWNSSVTDVGGHSPENFTKAPIRADFLALGFEGEGNIQPAEIGDATGSARTFLTQYLVLDSGTYRVQARQSDQGVRLDLLPVELPTGQLPLSAKARGARLTLVGTRTAVVLSKPNAVVTLPADTYWAPGLDYAALYTVHVGDVADAQSLAAPAERSGVVLLPSGEPASGALVYVADGINYVGFDGGQPTGPRSSLLAKTAGDGKFSFTPPADDYTLVVVHDAGWVHVPRQQFEANSQVRLQSWARVEGTLLRNGQPWPGEEIQVNLLALPPGPKGLYYAYSATTDRNGRFVFARFIPTRASIGHKVSADSGLFTVEGSVEIDARSGQTTQVSLGGNGRAVIGRIVGPNGQPLPPNWKTDLGSLGTNRSPVPSHPQDWDRMTAQQRQAYVQAWLKSPEGQKALQAAAKPRHKSFAVRSDGSFRIDNVEPGSYFIQVDYFDDGPDGRGSRTRAGRVLTTVAVPDGPLDVPVDIGTLQAGPVDPPPATQRAAATWPAPVGSDAAK